jgi:hypothetical protein
MDGQAADLILKKLKFLQYSKRKSKAFVYKFRAEIPLDAVFLLYVARYRMYAVSLQAYDPDRFGGIAGVEVVIHSTLSKEQIIKVVRAIPDGHRIEQTLEFVRDLN